ncbi:MAG: hypothetical protein KY460_12370 [Actinobacteria bacterium]|nr:hypothetical protein [Actinomycetota bacterium]
MNGLRDLGAVFGIDHRWYPYDITVLALCDVDAARGACGCLPPAATVG